MAVYGAHPLPFLTPPKPELNHNPHNGPLPAPLGIVTFLRATYDVYYRSCIGIDSFGILNRIEILSFMRE